MIIKKTKDMTDSERIAVENSNNQWLQALSYTAVGTIYPYAGTVAPDSFMICDGSALDKNEYPELFAVIGYSFGGSEDTFNIPDLRGRTLVGLKSDDEDFGAIGKSAGEKAHNLTTSEIPAHTHALLSNIAGVDTAAVNTFSGIGYFPSGKITNQGKYVNTGSAGSGEPHNNMQPYMVCNYIIKVVNKLSNELNIIVNVKADEEYKPDSENAQSGVAVAAAINGRMPKPILVPGAPIKTVSVMVHNDYTIITDPDTTIEEYIVNDSAFKDIIVDDGTLWGKETVSAANGCISTRDINGNLWTGEPIDDQDCVTYSMYKELLARVEALEQNT